MLRDPEPGAYACERCGGEAALPHHRCPWCQAQGTLRRVTRAAQDPEARASSGALADVRYAARPRIRTGIAPLDAALGNPDKGVLGFASGVVYVVAGGEGLGKSRMLMQMANGCADTRWMFASTEQTREELREMAEELGALRADIGSAEIEYLDEFFAACDRWRADGGLEAAVLDSLPELRHRPQGRIRARHEEPPDPADEVARTIAELLAWTRRTGVTVFAVNHLNAQGEAFGTRRSRHRVTGAVMKLTGNIDQELPAPRTLQVSKNRCGRSGGKVAFTMTVEGRYELADAPTPPPPRPRAPQAPERPRGWVPKVLRPEPGRPRDD